MRPFLPYSDDDRSHLLTAFMVGKSDGEDYGKLQVYEMPPGDFPRGPALVQGDIQRDPDVSELETLLGSRSQGSQVDYGSLTAIPIDGGLIYVRPFYVTSQQAPRSEEHTSELQSLMRISYAVFCLKTKKKTDKLTQ